MSNGYGDKLVTRSEDLRAYDALPPLLRRAVAYAVSPWSSWHLQQHYCAIAAKSGRAQAAQALIRHMIRGDRAQTLKAYGPSHPEAAPRADVGVRHG